jgi:hypothetical protein
MQLLRVLKKSKRPEKQVLPEKADALSALTGDYYQYYQ